jgi:hypothetical protein
MVLALRIMVNIPHIELATPNSANAIFSGVVILWSIWPYQCSISALHAVCGQPITGAPVPTIQRRESHVTHQILQSRAPPPPNPRNGRGGRACGGHITICILCSTILGVDFWQPLIVGCLRPLVRLGPLLRRSKLSASLIQACAHTVLSLDFLLILPWSIPLWACPHDPSISTWCTLICNCGRLNGRRTRRRYNKTAAHRDVPVLLPWHELVIALVYQQPRICFHNKNMSTFTVHHIGWYLTKITCEYFNPMAEIYSLLTSESTSTGQYFVRFKIILRKKYSNVFL